jgi:hypothetical protein
LPTDDADLAEWEVYADWLLTRDDPRGELLAHDLALPVQPSRDQLAAFHELAARACPQRRLAPIAWCLGHVRTLTVAGELDRRRARVDHGLLANVHQQLLGPSASRLEELECVYAPGPESKAWRRMFSALPPTCRRVAVTLAGPLSEAAADELMGWLPSTVEELALAPLRLSMNVQAQFARFVTDRFALVELRRLYVETDLPERLAGALAATHTVELRVGQIELARRLASHRCHLGSPTAAGVVASKHVAVLEPWSLLHRQNRYGVIPVRAQLARELPEDHGLQIGRGGDIRASWWGSDLVRRGTRWTIRPSEEIRVWRSGESLAGIAELRDGDELALQLVVAQDDDRVACTFVTGFRGGAIA